MPASKKRSTKAKPKGGLTKTARHKAALWLPLDRASADHISLKFHSALEVARRGAPDVATARVLSHAALLVGLIADAGHGEIDPQLLESLNDGLAAVLKRGHESDDWSFPQDLVALARAAVNEHDRQLRELRMGIIVEATEQLERRLAKATSMEEALRTRSGPAKP